MAFRFAGFVLTVFPHVDCNKLGTNGGGGGGGGVVGRCGVGGGGRGGGVSL